MKLKFVILVALVSIGLIACEKEETTPTNEEELITTISYTLTPTNRTNTVVLTFQDLDGDGGDAPTITGGSLEANTTYVGTLTLLNELESPAESITDEVEEEAEEHQFFFQTTVAGLAVDYTDQDADGNPIGLATRLTTTDAGSGSLTVILRHEPNKSGADVAKGDITNAGGETDIEVTFDIDVQ